MGVTMADLIAFASLRDLVTVANDESVDQVDFDLICDAFPALVEAVEAARPISEQVNTTGAFLQISRPDALRLQRALARFDFGEERVRP